MDVIILPIPTNPQEVLLARYDAILTSVRRLTFKSTSTLSPRELPAYTVSEAAHYLRIPVATLRSWVRGRYYPTERGRKFFQPVIILPDSSKPWLSFVNLVEAHVLEAIRRKHEVRLDRVRTAVNYMRSEFESKHPLADQEFETDRKSVV